MKVEDLMIGDWICSIIDRYDHIEKKSVRVTGIRADADVLLIQCDDTDVWYPGDSYEPIPITSMILKKNGFIHNDLPFEQCWQQFGLSLYPGGDGYRINCGDNVAIKIDYVHDLQHALKSCGVKKDIVIK